MKIHIWSDIRCPFCYIGKRKFEAALEKFPHKDKIEVSWRSFQLDPDLQTQPGINMYDYFAQLKGISREEAVEMNNRVKEIGREAGLVFNFDTSVVANSFNAHRLLQLAKTKGRAAETGERLFKAHFTDNRNIDDKDVLFRVGLEAGMDEATLKEVLFSNAFGAEVKQDEMAAQNIGVRGVPYFVFDDKYSISGAQSTDTFYQVLEKTWKESKGTEINAQKENNPE